MVTEENPEKTLFYSVFAILADWQIILVARATSDFTAYAYSLQLKSDWNLEMLVIARPFPETEQIQTGLIPRNLESLRKLLNEKKKNKIKRKRRSRRSTGV
jgi:hypothetical protein